MDLKDKIICAHKGFFSKESEKTYRENSAEVCRISGEKDYIKIIEVDVRKSKDGIPYCYHGTPLEYVTTMKLRRSFSDMKKKYGADTLKDVLAAIPAEKAVVLDIKDHAITRSDILDAMAGKRFRQVILGNRSVSYLKRFSDMPSEFVKLLNGNVLSGFYDFKKLKEDNFAYIEIVFPFLVSDRIIEKIKQSGLEFVGMPAVIFPSREKYWKLVEKYGLKYISSDFI